MTLPLTKLGRDVYAPTTSDGAPRGADMGDAAVHATEVEKILEALISGVGGITLTDDIIYAFNSGAGTANAIQAATVSVLSQAPFSQLMTVNFTEANTGPMTLALNGGAPRDLVTNTGQPILPGYVVAGMAAIFQVDTQNRYRLFSYGNAEAVQNATAALLEQARQARDASAGHADRSEAARDVAAGYASDAVSQGNVPIYSTVSGMGAISVPAGMAALRTNGFSAIGDGGGGLHAKLMSEPTHLGKFQSGDGAWWELAPPMRTVTPQMFGAKGDGVTDDHPAIQAALGFLWKAYGGGTLYFPPGDYLVKSTILLGETGIGVGDGMSNITMIGSGWNSRIIAADTMNGSDHINKNNIISINNFSGPVTSHAGYPQKNILIRDLQIDATLQSAAGIPEGMALGYSLAGIEVLNVDFVRVFNVKFKKCFGNGLVFGTQMPRQMNGVYQNGVRGCVAENNWFEDCLRGLLPQYASTSSPGGLTGSVMQAGSSYGFRCINNVCINPGGPFLDIFNGDGAVIQGNEVKGWGDVSPGYSPLAATLYQQTQGTIRSDFGLKNSYILDNTCHGIVLNGAMVSTFFNDNIPTPGPHDCTIRGNKIINPVGNTPITTPAIGPSGTTYTNPGTRPMQVYIIGGTGLTFTRRRGTDGTFAPYTPGYVSGIQLAAGDAFTMSYTTPPSSWGWQVAPNLFAQGIYISGGSIAGTPGAAMRNIIEGNTIAVTGQACMTIVDGQQNSIKGNIFEQPFFASRGAALELRSYTGDEGSGTIDNDVSDNTFRDVRTPPFLTANIEEVQTGTQRSFRNVYKNNNFEVQAAGGSPIIVSHPDNLIKDNHGPGWRQPVLSPQPSIPATNTPLFNPFPYDCFVAVSGGTVLNIAVGKYGFPLATLGLSDGLIPVRQGEQIQITYSVAPTNFTWIAAS